METWLKENEGVVFDNYECFCPNRALLSRKAVRDSGGVGVLAKNVILRDWSVKVVDAELEHVMWVKLEHKETSNLIAVCFFPQASSSRDIDIEEHFHVLRKQVGVGKFRLWCVVTSMGDVEKWVTVMDYSADVVWTW